MNKQKSEIPTYNGHWFWKSAIRMMKDPIGFNTRRVEELGDTFYARFPFGKVLVTSKPSSIKHILQTNQKNYEKDRSYDQLALLLGKGLVTSRGEFWRKQRRIAQPSFYKKSLEKLYLDMVTVTENYCKELNEKRGQEIDISKEMMAVTAKIAMKSLFGKKLEGNLVDIYECISYAQQFITTRSFNPLTILTENFDGTRRQFKRQRKVMDDLIFGLIEERKKSKEEHHDFLQMLLDARYEDTGEPMEKEQLRDELVTIFSAGHETSANALAWTIYLLSERPDIVKKLRAEIDAVLGDKTPTFEDLRNLTYTRQVIEEGMRVFPPVWSVGRIAKQDDYIDGHFVKAKTIVFSLIYHVHHHPELWENAEEFNPDHFEAEKVKARPKMHYLPFGAGPRMCIGNHFAMMEMQLLLPLIIRSFDFELIKNQKIEMEPMITLRPKYGIRMVVK